MAPPRILVNNAGVQRRGPLGTFDPVPWSEIMRANVGSMFFVSQPVGRTPARRWGDVRDLAGSVIFLASVASDFVNGHVPYVDGGVTAAL